MVIIILGLNLSRTITTPIIYFLFWLLYIITILSVVNIIMSVYYYLAVRNKRGPAGPRGPDGQQGEVGDVGKCAPNCRESICTDKIINTIIDYLGKLEPNKPIKLNNVFIKEKIKSLCQSPQFQELSPYKGADNLIKYLVEIWKIWIDLLFAAGGRVYFETIGAEMEWEWVEKNPYEEIKKYDVFYWGLDKEYWPEMIDKCYKEDVSGNLVPIPTGIIKTTVSNNMTLVGNLSGGDFTASIWRPKNITYEGVNYYPLGDVVIGPTNKNDTRRQKIQYSELYLDNKIVLPVITTYLVGGDYVAPPVDYDMLWTNNKIWIWRPRGPTTADGEYIALGDIATSTANKPSIGDLAPVRCVLKAALTKITSDQKQIWATKGTNYQPMNLLGFSPYDGRTAIPNAADSNSYNLFRYAPNNIKKIPSSDEYASFYYIKSNYYDINDQPGKTRGQPFNPRQDATSKGWLNNPTKDSKYSILAYLNLKPNMKATSSDKSTDIELISNTTFGQSNSYIVKYNDRCLEVSNNSLISKLCNFSKINQCFRIEMTGKAKGQFQLLHINSGKFLQSKISKFQLVDKSNKNTIFYML